MFVGVSFAKTPVDEVSAKHGEILALGLAESDRGDPWAVSYRKDIEDDQMRDPERELREVMGGYWVDAEGIRSPLDK